MFVLNKTVIEVVPNKWLHLGPTGIPQGAVARDPIDGRGHIGATYDFKTGTYSFSDGIVKTLATRQTIKAIKHGDLFLASKEYASAIGVVPFVDPMKLLAESRAAAIAAYDAQHGENAWAEQNEPTKPAEPTKAERKTSNKTE